MSEPVSTSAPFDERRLAAIVFTDVVGYSARMQRDEVAPIATVRAGTPVAVKLRPFAVLVLEFTP